MKVLPGIYRHYNGGIYQVLMTAKHFDTKEMLVIYRSLSCAQKDVYWAQPVESFNSFISVRQDFVAHRFSLLRRVKPFKHIELVINNNKKY